MKKILSILLAICLMVGMVTVLASADEAPKAYISMPSAENEGGAKKITITEGADDMYWLTTEDGWITSEGASAENFNVMLSYAAGDMPTLYLNGANLTAVTGASKNCSPLQIGRYSADTPSTNIADFDLCVIVMADSTLTSAWRTWDGTASGTTHGAPTINIQTAGTVTFTGTGKLTAFSPTGTVVSKSLDGNLDFVDANICLNLEIEKTWSSFKTLSAATGNVTFRNTTAEILNNYNGCISITEGTLTIEGGSNVSAISTSNGVWQGSVVNVPGGTKIDNATLLVHGVGESMYAIGKNPFEFVGVNAIGGTKEANAKAYKEGRASGYMYFLAGPDVVTETEPVETLPPATTAPATQPVKPTTSTTEPAATQPAESKPAESKPAATEPAATEPEATEPAGSAPAIDTMTILYIVLGVVILAGVVVVIIVIVKRNAADDEDEDEEDEEDEDEEEEDAE